MLFQEAKLLVNLALIKQGNVTKKLNEYVRSTIQDDIDDIMKSKDSIGYESSFSEYKSGKFLLLEAVGRPL